MSATCLSLRALVSLPVEAECICPDRLAGLARKKMEALPVLYGRHPLALGELFSIQGDGTEEIVLEGDLRHIKYIGQGMSRGRITVHGDAGMHLGDGMRGGEIAVHGNADAWAGANMRGGLLWVHGSARAMLGGAYPGEKRGMTGGTIVVDGDAGPRAGERMRRGLLIVLGDAGEFTGARMIAGSILVFGLLGARAGAGMVRGSILALGGLSGGLLPTFLYACTYQPDFVRLTLRYLQQWGLPVTSDRMEGRYRRYSGDITALGKGEILVYDQHQ